MSKDKKEQDIGKMPDGRIVLCGANAYEQKYYFNPLFGKIPKSIQDEIHIVCVLFTEEVGGVITFIFEEDGSLSIETEAAEDDYLYDEISSGLLISKIRRNRQELLSQLSLYYRIFILHENIDDVMAEWDAMENGEEVEGTQERAIQPGRGASGVAGCAGTTEEEEE